MILMHCIKEAYIPRGPQPLEAFKIRVKSLLDEYFVSGVVDEAERALVELGHDEFHHEFVKLVISKYVHILLFNTTLFFIPIFILTSYYILRPFGFEYIYIYIYISFQYRCC